MFRKADVAHLKPDYLAVDNHMVYGINDIAVWTNLAIQGNAVYLVEPLSQFRIHSSQSQAELRDEVFAGAIEGIKIMRASWDRRGLSRGQYWHRAVETGTESSGRVAGTDHRRRLLGMEGCHSRRKEIRRNTGRCHGRSRPGSNRVRAEPENAAPPSRPAPAP